MLSRVSCGHFQGCFGAPRRNITARSRSKIRADERPHVLPARSTPTSWIQALRRRRDCLNRDDEPTAPGATGPQRTAGPARQPVAPLRTGRNRLPSRRPARLFTIFRSLLRHLLPGPAPPGRHRAQSLFLSAWAYVLVTSPGCYRSGSHRGSRHRPTTSATDRAVRWQRTRPTPVPRRAERTTSRRGRPAIPQPGSRTAAARDRVEGLVRRKAPRAASRGAYRTGAPQQDGYRIVIHGSR